MSDFNNTDDVNDLMPRVIDSTCWKDLDLDDCKERIAELERQRDYWQDAAKHKIGSIAKLEAKNRRLVELLKTSVAEFDDGIKYPLEVVNDLKQVLASMEER